jgi:hypothetical protein
MNTRQHLYPPNSDDLKISEKRKRDPRRKRGAHPLLVSIVGHRLQSLEPLVGPLLLPDQLLGSLERQVVRMYL